MLVNIFSLSDNVFNSHISFYKTNMLYWFDSASNFSFAYGVFYHFG